MLSFILFPMELFYYRKICTFKDSFCFIINSLFNGIEILLRHTLVILFQWQLKNFRKLVAPVYFINNFFRAIKIRNSVTKLLIRHFLLPRIFLSNMFKHEILTLFDSSSFSFYVKLILHFVSSFEYLNPRCSYEIAGIYYQFLKNLLCYPQLPIALTLKITNIS